MRSHNFWVSDEAISETTYRVSGGGEMDLASRSDLSDALERAEASGATKLELDFTDVGFIDSTAIKVIARAAVNVRERGGKIEMTVGQPNVLRIFAITGLDRLFELTLTLPTLATIEDPV